MMQKLDEKILRPKSWRTGSHNRKPKKKTTTKSRSVVIVKLLERFSVVWGAKWESYLEKHGSKIAREWLEALKDAPDDIIDKAFEKARYACIWPPTIAEFMGICRELHQGVAQTKERELKLRELREDKAHWEKWLAHAVEKGTSQTLIDKIKGILEKADKDLEVHAMSRVGEKTH